MEDTHKRMKRRFSIEQDDRTGSPGPSFPQWTGQKGMGMIYSKHWKEKKKKTLLTKNAVPGKYEGDIGFSQTKKRWEVATGPALQEMLSSSRWNESILNGNAKAYETGKLIDKYGVL